MSLPWSSKGIKAAPVNADELLILDSEDSNPSTQNKRITIDSLAVVAGEVNTSSNSGTGNGWAQPKVGVDLPFKSLITIAPLDTTVNMDDLTLTLDPITNTNIAPTAAINFSKLEALNDGNILVGSNLNVPTSVVLSGDATLLNTGAITIVDNAITDAKIVSHTSTKITITSKSQLNSNIVYNDQPNLYTTFTQSFPNTALEILNPAGTNGFLFTSSAIIADRSVTLPLLTGNDTFVFVSHAQTLANKTLTMPIIADFTNATHDHSNAVGGGILTNSALSSGVFSNITGIGSQSQALDMNNNLINNLATPLTNSDGATKQYVDNAVEGLAWKDAAVLGTTGNITLSGNQVIDGVMTNTSDRVLVKDQTAGEENGLYEADPGAWTRTTDADTESKLLNMSVFIQQGTVNADTSYVLVTDSPIIVDTTVLVYTQIAGSFTSPLTTKGDLLGFDTGNNRIPVGTDGQILTANSAVGFGVEWASPAAFSQTPWLQDIDADGFDLQDISNVEFRTSSGAPGGSVPAIFNDVNGVKVNTPSTLSFQINVNAIGEYTFNASEFDTLGNNISLGLGTLLFDDVNTSIAQNANNLRYDVTGGGIHIFRISNIDEYEFVQGGAEFHNNQLLDVGDITLNGEIFFPDGVRQRFNPDATIPGLNFGAQVTPDPTGGINGDVYYNSTNNKFRGFENGAWTDLVQAVAVSPPFVDSTSIVEGSVDITKELRFEVDGNTTGVIGVFATTFTTAKVLTFPDTTDLVIARNTTDTLTNKTLTEPKFADLGFIADINGNEMIIFDTVASAVNNAQFANAATGIAPTLSAVGGDPDIDFRFIPKGTGTFYGVRESFAWPLTDEVTAPTVGVTYTTEPAPYDMDIEEVIAGLTTAGTGAALFTFDILKEDSVNADTFTTIFSTKPTIDSAEFTTTTAMIPSVISVSTWEKGRRLQLTIDTVDTDGLARGAKLILVTHATAK